MPSDLMVGLTGLTKSKFYMLIMYSVEKYPFKGVKVL